MLIENKQDVFVVTVFVSLCSHAIVECKTRKQDMAEMLPLFVAQGL